MDIKDFLSPASVAADLQVSDKTRLLKQLSGQAAAALELDPEAIAGEILKREALGSTGIGNGVAIPHARIPGLARPYGVFVRLKAPIAFEAIDDQPVDLVFLLLLPATDEQLNALACVARKLRDEDALRNAREAAGDAELYRVIAAASPEPEQRPA